MRILVTGASGLVGSALVPALAEEGHTVLRLVRHTPGPGEVCWAPDAGSLDAAALEGLDAVIHLAGESLNGRWTAARKARIRESRAQGTRLLSRTLAGLQHPPDTLISVSAIGYYGDRGDEVLREENPPGKGFLAEVCQEWEAATQPAADRGIRVVIPRLGMILSCEGGALAEMLLPFRLGVGGPLGSGKQWMSWITRDDVVGVMRHLLETTSLSGPVNATAPQPVTNAEFTRILGRVLLRPTLFRVPAVALRLAFGELADAAFLGSQRVQPARLLATGYAFLYPNLEGALRHVLRRPRVSRAGA